MRAKVLAAIVSLVAAREAGAFDPRRGGAQDEVRERSYTAAHFLLELDGKAVGWLRSAEGGDMVADVTSFRTGTGVTSKHLGGLRNEPIVLELGPDLPAELAAWLKDFLDGRATRKDGAVVAVDPRGVVRTRRTFTGAVLTDVMFPALDATSREPLVLALVLQPEFTRYDRKPPPAPVNLPPGPPGSRRGVPTRSQFAFSLAGLDGAGVTRVEAFALSRPLLEVGSPRDPQVQGPLTVPDLLVTTLDARADAWWAWFDDFVVKGDSGDANERSGRITLYDAAGAELLRLDLSHAGIAALRPLQPGGGAVPRGQARFYMEGVALTVR